MSDTATNWDSLDATHAAAWTVIGRGTADPKAPTRNPVLATRGLDGGGEARIVVLRAASSVEATLTVYTDTLSTKVSELAEDSRATLLFWVPRQMFQIRARGPVTVTPGRGEVWTGLSDGAKSLYGMTPPPGEPVGTPDAAEARPDPARFGVATMAVQSLETLHLGRTRHRRARFDRSDAFTGAWLAP